MANRAHSIVIARCRRNGPYFANVRKKSETMETSMTIAADPADSLFPWRSDYREH
jgi:hypothetical protein